MNKRRQTNHRKKETGANASVESDVLEALAEFTEALDKGEVLQRPTCQQMKQNEAPAAAVPKPGRDGSAHV